MDTRIEIVKKLSLKPGDILHIIVGGDIQTGDGRMVTWVPSADELQDAAILWNAVLPPEVGALVTHHLVDEAIIQSQIRVGTWPPKVKKNGP